MRRMAVLAVALAAVACVGCSTVVGDEPAGGGATWFSSEWGGSEVVESTIERRVTTHPDGRVVEEFGVEESHSVNHGLSDNIKGLAALVIGFLVGS